MSTYADLQASFLDFVKDTALDSADAQKFIAIAEPKLERDLLDVSKGGGVPRQMLARIADTTDAANKITLPTDYLSARSVRIGTQRARYASPELVNPEDSGYASADVVLDYYQRIPVLSPTNVSNWLLDVGYDAYLWAACIQYAAWGQEMDTVRIWSGYYADALNTVKNAYKPQPRGNLYRHPSKFYQSFYTIIGADMVFGRAQQ